MPKDIHVEPEKFAAELINRLEEVQKEREAEEKLEERLKRVRAVSNLLASSPSLCAYCTPQGASSCCGTNLDDHFPASTATVIAHMGAPGGSHCPRSFHGAVPWSVWGYVSSSTPYGPAVPTSVTR